MQMREGKIAESVCRRSVLRQLHTKPQYDIDGMVYNVNPEFIYTSNIGIRGVYRAANHIAAKQGIPVGVVVECLLPLSMQEEEVKALICRIDKACEKAKMSVLGGHTQVTKSVNQPILSFTGIGKRQKTFRPQTEYSGMDVVVTKWIALEGTAILAEKKEKELQTRYPQAMIDTAKEFYRYLPAWTEAVCAGKFDGCVMQDVSQGGIFGTLWELASNTGVGLDIDLKKIPIRQETVEICEFFDLNPYELCGQGSMLIFSKDGTALCRELEKMEISATLIGKTTDQNERILWNAEEKRFLEPPKMDEIYKIL